MIANDVYNVPIHVGIQYYIEIRLLGLKISDFGVSIYVANYVAKEVAKEKMQHY